MNTVFFNDALSPIEFPRFLRERGFADDSWHNDVNPKATIALSRARTLAVWVAENTPEEREDLSMAKYTVCVYPDDWGDAFSVGSTDSDWACAALVDAVLKRDADGELTEMCGEE